jgi:hypothetical protein
MNQNRVIYMESFFVKFMMLRGHLVADELPGQSPAPLFTILVSCLTMCHPSLCLSGGTTDTASMHLMIILSLIIMFYSRGE